MKVTKRRKGGTLVLIIFVIIMVTTFISILSIYFISTAIQATKQRSQIQAYYLASAGLEIGISMLMETAVNAAGEQYYPLLEYYAANTAPVTETVVLDPDKEVVITIDAVDADGNTWVGGVSGGGVWVRILAVGTHTNSYGSTVQAGTFRINSENPANVIRELVLP